MSPLRLSLLRDLVRTGPVVVALIEIARGSTPREAGTWMIVAPRGTHGTIGGGEAERRVVEAASGLLSRSSASLVSDAAAGQMTVLASQPGSPDNVAAAAGDNVGSTTGAASGLRPGRQAGRARGGPDATLDLPLGPRLDQCCGGFMRVALSLVTTLPDGPFALWESGPVVADPVTTPVVVYGAGHVGAALVEALSPLPFSLTWIDGRAEVVWPVEHSSVALRRSALPEADVMTAPDDAMHLVMTHSHALDLEIVAAVLARPFAFLGLIGSATKRATFARQLAARGLDASRITCPIGIGGIRGKEPAVIAASVAAQLLVLAGTSRP